MASRDSASPSRLARMMSTARMGGRQYIVWVLMAQRSSQAADTTKQAVNLARALTIGMRSWGFYPPEHPAVGLAVDRMIAACTEATAGGMLQLAVTPHALLIDGLPLDSTDLSVAECAELLHDRDVLQFTVEVGRASRRGSGWRWVRARRTRTT